uniref:Uncharacterized protein n=1 Tax=Panagrolaimus davidi TaxID=227884 RepID=A0A914QLH5_9BILA
MKLPLTLSFFVAVIQLCSSNILSKREILLSDATAVQNGSDVIMVKPGPLEVVLNNASELIFGVCEQNCFGEFLVCFEGAKNDSFSTEFCDSQCGFYVNVDDRDEIVYFSNFTKQDNSRPKMNCTEMVMRDKVTIQEGYYAFTYPSCLPKVENGIVKLNITTVTDKCVVSIKNAKIKPEEIIATSAPNSPSNNPSSDPSSSATTKIIGNFGWIFVLISFFAFHQ